MQVLPYGLDRHHHEAGLSAGEPLLVEESLFEPPTPSYGGHPLSSLRGRRGGGGGGGVGGTRYPRTFAFSAVVPKLSLELHRMVVLCCLYGLHLQLPVMETTVLKVRFVIGEALMRVPSTYSTVACSPRFIFSTPRS